MEAGLSTLRPRYERVTAGSSAPFQRAWAMLATLFALAMLRACERRRAMTPGLTRMRLASSARVTSRPVVLVLHSPMTADGAREDFRGQHDGRRIKRGFFPPFPEPCGGGTDQCKSRDAHDCGDQRRPFVVIEGGAGSIDFDTPVFLAIRARLRLSSTAIGAAVAAMCSQRCNKPG